jgi:UDP-galactopyranose mutase
MFDYLIVGAGLYGAAFARRMTDAGKRCIVIDKRGHVGGNAYTRTVEGIDVHEYGAHIFHTKNQRVWAFVNRFARFHRYSHAPVANYHGELFSLPFNMNTFYQMWGVTTPAEARAKIEEQRAGALIEEPRNLEEQAISLVGRDIYEKLVRGYTKKQWGRDCDRLPAFIIRRLPVRFTFDNRYFNDPYEGVPVDGYTDLVERMLKGIALRLNTDYLKEREALDALAKKTVFTGPIDAYYTYSLGHLEYRSLRFETEVLQMPNYQGCSVMNYTDETTAYTRIIEHKHFLAGKQDVTVISREYPLEWTPGAEPFYPVNDAKNQALFQRYEALAVVEKRTLFGGRLGDYAYYDMDRTVEKALEAADREIGG